MALLPTEAELIGDVSNAQMKVRLAAIRQMMEDLLGTDSSDKAAARAALGLDAIIGNSGGVQYRNRVINGDMRIDQRNDGAAVSTNGAYPVDRFPISATRTGFVCSAQRSTVAPPGFINSLSFSTTTVGVIGAGDTISINHAIEGYNVADFNFGTANAKDVVLSFWVRSSLTGLMSGALRNHAANRSYPFTYTVNAANTWEWKEIPVPGDTQGVWERGNLRGIMLILDLGTGTNFRTTPGAWASGNYVGALGTVQPANTVGSSFYVTGVQLELGTKATSFERRDYGDELRRCQRYYWKLSASMALGRLVMIGGFDGSASAARMFGLHPVPMRTIPVMRFAPGANFNLYCSAGAPTVASFSEYVGASQHTFSIMANLASPATLLSGAQLALGANAYIEGDAEL